MVKLDIAELERAGSANATNDTAEWHPTVVPILEFGMQKNTVSHFEIYASDPKKLADFYTKLFDWKVTEMPQMDYIVVHSGDTDGKGMLKSPGAINGGIARRPEGFTINGAVNYSMVDSIEDSVARALSLGAKMTKGRTAVPGMGWFAMFTDPEGNNFAVFKADAAAK